MKNNISGIAFVLLQTLLVGCGTKNITKPEEQSVEEQTVTIIDCRDSTSSVIYDQYGNEIGSMTVSISSDENFLYNTIWLGGKRSNNASVFSIPAIGDGITKKYKQHIEELMSLAEKKLNQSTGSISKANEIYAAYYINKTSNNAVFVKKPLAPIKSYNQVELKQNTREVGYIKVHTDAGVKKYVGYRCRQLDDAGNTVDITIWFVPELLDLCVPAETVNE